MEPTQPTKKETNYILPGAILLAALLISGSILASKFAPAPVAVSAAIGQTAPAAAIQGNPNTIKPLTAADHIRGSLNASVIVVEYSDLECPFCKEFQATMQQLINEYGPSGKLAWVYRNYPIAALHSKAPAEAAAAECANLIGGNDVYWNYIDKVFATTNSNNSLDPAELPKIAADVGLDMTQWSQCVASGQTTVLVFNETADALAVGAQGTPYSVIINTKTGTKTIIPGALPYKEVKAMIDSALVGK